MHCQNPQKSASMSLFWLSPTNQIIHLNKKWFCHVKTGLVTSQWRIRELVLGMHVGEIGAPSDVAVTVSIHIGSKYSADLTSKRFVWNTAI